MCDYDEFAGNILNAKVIEKWLVDKSDIAGLIENSDLDKKIATLATKSRIKSRARQNVKTSSVFLVKVMLKMIAPKFC